MTAPAEPQTPAPAMRPPAVRRVTGALDAWLGSLVELIAAALVATEIVILFGGVVARYVFNHPLVWSDELASILFLWLAMFGAVIAFHRDEHMRMTAAIGLLTPATRAIFDAFATGAALAFLLLIMVPACDYAVAQRPITTPALQIPDAWRAAALPSGIALMAIFALLRLANAAPRSIAISLGAVVAVIALFWLAEPIFRQLGNLNLLIFFVGVVAACVFAGVPIAFAFGLAVFGYLALATQTPLTVLVGRMNEGMSHLILLAVPLFIFLGLLIEMAAMARAMVAFLASVLGHVRGGLHYVLVAAMYLVSGISGSKAADMAAVAPVLFPEMKARGATPGDLVALLAATGAQTETIPPSLVLITIGSVTGVLDCRAFYRWSSAGDRARRLALLCDPVALSPRAAPTTSSRATKREVGRAFLIALPAMALPFLIRAAVVEGVATATEVSTIGIVYSAIVGLVVYRRFDWAALRPMLVSTAGLSGAILLIIGTATGMAWGLTQSGFSRSLAAAMTGLPGGAATFMAASIVAFVVLGSVLEGIPAIVLFGPLLFPIAKAVGIHEVHYAMVVILAMGIGLFAPPFGVGYYAACAIGRVEPAEGMRPIWGYMLALVLGTIIVAAVPWISTGFLK